MAKQKFGQRGKIVSGKGQPSSSSGALEAQFQRLLGQQQYRQALDELKKIRRSNPDFQPTPSEAEIWLKRGVQEFQKDDFKQAEPSLRRALELGLTGEAHYWLARCLLGLNRLDSALDLIRNAFDNSTLPKDYSICYPKLLLLKGDTAAVEALISKQAKRFSAAQLNWVRGVLALKRGEKTAALTAFFKIKQPLTPGDSPNAWVVYTQQSVGNWDAAAQKLGLGVSTLMWRPPFPHPILERLATLQQAKTNKPPLSPSDTERGDQSSKEAKTVLAIAQLLEQDNPHDAAHLLITLGRQVTQYPELAALRPTLMILAGQQALTQGQPECAEGFWKPLLSEQPFNPQLAVNLLIALDQNESYQEQQRLLTRLVNWVEQDAKKNPQTWPEARLKPALAHLHCSLADTWMALERPRAAMGALQQAERIAPDSPEVIGRRGVIAALEKRYEDAIRLLTQALEQGCRYDEVYINLINVWDKLGNKSARVEARRRFGKFFGDVMVEDEVEVAPWVDALSSPTYSLFSRILQSKDQPDPAMRACQIFVEAAQGQLTSGGRISLDQATATQRWNELLKSLSPEEQRLALQAIAIVISRFAKREKGIAALITQYVNTLATLAKQYPAAREAHLVALAIKESNSDKLKAPFQAYLDTQPQPGSALAAIQFQVRQFAQTVVVRPLIDAALQREPQNPMLLLAKATTFSPGSQPYEDLYQQGFDLARRLQDAKALQAFRDEQAFLNRQDAAEVLPDPETFDSFDDDDMDDFLEAMIRKLFGSKMPRAELERMMPQLKAMMRNTMPDFADDDMDDDDLDLDAIFGSSKPRKRRRDFRSL